MNKKQKKFIYNGYKGTGQTPTDFLAGEPNRINWVVISEAMDHEQFLPKPEYQHFDWGDSFDCVTRGVFNSIETILKEVFNEETDWSDRATAVASGTDPYRGNTIYAVIESVRKLDGMISQEQYPNVASSKTEYYLPLTVAIKNEMGKSLSKYKIEYEWIQVTSIENLKEGLKYCPLVIPIFAYGKLVNGVYQKIVGNMPNHVVLLYRIDSYLNIFDNYQGKEKKKLALDYLMGPALKIKITKIDDNYLLSQKVMEYLKQNENKLVQNTGDGSIGIIVGGKVKVTTAERAGLLALTALIRQGGGGGVTQEMWDAMPKETF